MILLILAALIALVARVDAAGAADDDAIELAIHYADALTSLASDPARAPTLDAPNQDDEDDEDAEDDDADDGEASAVQRADPEEDDDDETTQPDLAGDAPAVLDVDREVDEENRAKSIHPTSIDDELTVTDILRARDEENGDLSIRPTSIDDELTASIDDQGDGGVGDADSGRLAMLDAELDPGDTTAGGDAAYAAAPAGAAELYEQSLRHRRPSRWGRLDVGVALRRRWSEPIHAPASRRDEVWLVATWRR